MRLAALTATCVYLPLKVVYVAVGVPVAGLTWLFTGGDGEVAGEVLAATTSGDYVVTASHLRNPGTLQFSNRASGGATYAGGLPSVSAPPPNADSIICADFRSIRGVHFQLNEAKIGKAAAAQLDYVAAALDKCDDHMLRIDGYTDSLGSSEFNTSLAGQRAEAVKVYLVDHGIREKRLVAKGFADASPAASNQTSAGRAQNRRVELALVLE